MTVQARANAPVECALGVVAPIDLPSVFHGFGPLPAVVATREQTGAWDAVGDSRVLELGDGSEARERLTVYDPPGHFAYRIDSFTGSLRLLVDHVDGAWWFEPVDGARTEVRWTYAFVPRAAAARIPVRLIIAPLWRIYARRTLRLAVQAVERQAPRAQASS